MCISPRTIKNVYRSHPNYWRGLVPHVSPITKETHDTTSDFIEVPCGDCVQCRSRKQTDLLQRIQMESLSNYLFMFTLTYNNKHVPTFALPNGKVIMRADYKHIIDMFKRIRKEAYFGSRKFKYLVCSEFAPKHARPHYHGILFLQKLPSDGRLEYVNLEKLAKEIILKEWRVNVARTIAKKDTKRYKAGETIVNTRKPVYEPLCDYIRTFRNGKWRCTYDLHYVTPMSEDGTNDVSFYVMKYLFKVGSGEKFVQACTYQSMPSKSQASRVYGKYLKSCNHKSLGIGMGYVNPATLPDVSTPISKVSPEVLHKICSMVNTSLENNLLPSFFDIYTGKKMPLSRYYFERCLSIPMRIAVQKLIREKIDSGELCKDIYESYTKAMLKYRNQSEKTFVTDIFDDDQLFNKLEFDDDLPDDIGEGIIPVSDEELKYNQSIEPSPLDWEDLPAPITPEEKVVIIQQLSLNLS